MWLGCCWSEVLWANDAGSPKFHDQLCRAGPELGVERLVKLTEAPEHELSEINNATGEGETVNVFCERDSQPMAVFTIKTTLYVPLTAYECEVFPLAGALNTALVPSPKSQCHESILLPETESITEKNTGLPVQFCAEMLKTATGGSAIVTDRVFVLEQPAVSVMVNDTR